MNTGTNSLVVPVRETLLAEEPLSWKLGPKPTVGNSWERASAMTARAAIRFWKARRISWLSVSTLSSRALSSGSLNISHHLPRSIASCGWATFQASVAGKFCGDSLYAAGGA